MTPDPTAGRGVAAAAYAENERSLTFTVGTDEVICRLFGQSEVRAVPILPGRITPSAFAPTWTRSYSA